MSRFSPEEQEFLRKILDEADGETAPPEDEDPDDDTEIIIARGKQARSFLEKMFGPADEDPPPENSESDKVVEKKSRTRRTPTKESVEQDATPPSVHKYFS